MKDLIEIKEFIARARINTWAGGLGKQGAKRTGSEGVFVFEEGELKYEDEYFGGPRFQGEEIVYENGKPVWGMVYFGGVPESVDVNSEEEFDFLKKALLSQNKLARFPRVAEYEEGEREYSCLVDGEMNNFTGHETVTHKGTVTHEVFFAGGIIK